MCCCCLIQLFFTGPDFFVGCFPGFTVDVLVLVHTLIEQTLLASFTSGVETRAVNTPPQAFRVFSKAALLAPTTPLILELVAQQHQHRGKVLGRAKKVLGSGARSWHQHQQSVNSSIHSSINSARSPLAMADGGEAVFFPCKTMPSGHPGGRGWARRAFLFFFRVLFLLLGVAGLRRRGRLGRCQGGGVFLLSGVECLERVGGRSNPARTSFDLSCCQEGAWPVGWQDGRAFFFGGFPVFSFRARQEAAWGASRRRVLRRSPFCFSVFASLVEASALQAPPGGGV